MTKEERAAKLKEKFDLMKSIEKDFRSRGYKYIAGVDEVGRGPLAGPVVAAAVILPEDFNFYGIDDSKKLSEKKRNELNELIKGKALAIGIGVASNVEIDKINILNATKKAMQNALKSLGDELMRNIGEKPDLVLIDAVRLDNLNIRQENIIKGDAKVLSIAAASIVAKVYRDNLMIEYSREYPGYDFEHNKGYGTKNHYEGIENLGITKVHRKTFLRKFLNEE